MKTVLPIGTITAILVVVALILPNAMAANPSGIHAGRVRDIDFLGNHTQIIISGPAPTDDLVATVADDRLQSLLQSAFLTGRTVQVSAKGVITKVTLRSSLTHCSTSGCVQELRCTTSCEATIADRAGQAITANRRALGILLTAINKDIPVEELITDKNDQIARVKVNIP